MGYRGHSNSFTAENQQEDYFVLGNPLSTKILGGPTGDQEAWLPSNPKMGTLKKSDTPHLSTQETLH